MIAPFLIYRNKVAAQDYQGKISNVPCCTGKPFSSAPESYGASASTMGPYAPSGVECTVADFLEGKCGG